MDKETLSNYGWIVICVLVLAVMMALATPFGKFVGDGFKSTYEGLYNTMTKGLSVIQVDDEKLQDPELNPIQTIPEGGTYMVRCYLEDNGSGSWAVEVSDEIYYEGDPFPTAQPGDIYRYGNYEYCYGYDMCCDHYSMECCDVTISGWAARCINDVPNPGPILNSINGINDIKIADYAFAWADGFQSIETFEIKSDVTEIGESAFAMTALKSVDLSRCNSLTTIGESAFSYCTSLTSIILPDSVTTIGDYAFYYCQSLVSITIPSSVTTIDYYAFSECYSLTNITFEGTTAEWNAITFGENWNDSVPATYVQCSDGKVNL